MTEALWWRSPERREQWNGVFQGGGAKGVAYVGALRAVQEAGCWFRAVAGSSAGAITACMIAASLTPDEIETASRSGLSQVRKVSRLKHLQAILGADQPLFETDNL